MCPPRNAAVAVSPLLLANAGLSPGDTVSVSTIGTSGVEVLEADRLTLIYDAKGKPGKDSFFEAYVKEVLGACGLTLSLPRACTRLSVPFCAQSTSSSSRSTTLSSSPTTASFGDCSSRPPRAPSSPLLSTLPPTRRPRPTLRPLPPRSRPSPSRARRISSSGRRAPSGPPRLARRRPTPRAAQRRRARTATCPVTSRSAGLRARSSSSARW